MSVAPTHQGADRMQKKKRKKRGGGRVRKGTDREVEIKKGLEEGLGGRRGKGGRKEERGRRKHMDLFKNTAIYQSQAHSESIGASKVRKKKKKRLVEIGC